LIINSNDSNSFAAFYKNGEVSISKTSEFVIDSDSRKQPDKLVNCLNYVSKRFAKEIDNVDAIAVTTGPGSFTAIRVGLSLAKGYAFGLNKKIIPVDNFFILLNRITGISHKQPYCVLIPAKNPEYYYAIIKENRKLSQGITEVKDLNNLLDKGTVIVSDFGDESDIKHCYFAYENAKLQKTEVDSISELAVKSFLNNEVYDPEIIEPLYIKEFAVRKPIRD
jgi:tRNA threonylcarbamoyladenosine biosynthesis protein TsaB